MAKSRRYRLSDRKVTRYENATLREQLAELKARMVEDTERDRSRLSSRNVEQLSRE